jgi:endo-1,4-beta-mannosidase
LYFCRGIKSKTDKHHVLTDEGYEEGKLDDYKKFSTTVAHVNFINFANARKRKQEIKVGWRFMSYLLRYKHLFQFLSFNIVFLHSDYEFLSLGNCNC